MRGKWKSGIRIFAGAVLAAAVLAGCSSKTAESGAAQDAGQNTAQGNSDSQEVRKVYVAVGATFEPYTYIDENNQPAGYDVAVYRRSTTAFHSMNSRLKTWNLPTFCCSGCKEGFHWLPAV